MAQSQSQSSTVTVDDDDDCEHKLRKYLLLLASLAATVTYAAGLDPPGGSWGQSDDDGDGEKMAAGNSILRATHHGRYLVFYYSNATAFAASLVVILLLLVLADKKKKKSPPAHSDQEDTTSGSSSRPFLQRGFKADLQSTNLVVLRLVMVLDLLALMVAYTAGSFREKVATIYAAALVLALSAYVGFHILEALLLRRRPTEVEDESSDPSHQPQPPPYAAAAADELEQLRKVLMLLSIFAATITYDGGLKPPGGFWEHTSTSTNSNGQDQDRAGEVILKHRHGGRFAVFFFCNTTAFIASLFALVLLLDKKLTASAKPRLVALYGFVVVTLVTLVAAYAAGSCRSTATTAYTVALVAAVLVCVFLAAVAGYYTGRRQWFTDLLTSPRAFDRLGNNGDESDKLKEKRSLVLLLGTLAASITYQAGLNPPGGVWLENQQQSSGSHGHNAGDPILSDTDHTRYTIFFYCNSAAFVASVVVILMVQIKALLKRNALHVAMILDLVGIMGAYIAGSSRSMRASVHVLVMAAAFLVYVAGTYLHVVKSNNTNNSDDPQNDDAAAAERTRTILKKRRKRLLLFAILMAAITYQAGLSPPGGFWQVPSSSSSVGSPILEDMYPRRYRAFFYCNAMSFMASIALIILLQDDRTYQQAGIRFYGLYACMLVGMLVLMGAYAAGTARRVRTSVYVFVLVGGVSVFIGLLLVLFLYMQRQQQDQQQRPSSSSATTHRQSSSNANGSHTAENNNRNSSSNNNNSNNITTITISTTTNNNNNNNNNSSLRRREEEDNAKRKYVMLLAMLAASVTYQAGLDPPGGVWPDGYAAGSPVLHDSNLCRYHIFFYSNSSSFMASVVVIILLLQSELRNMKCNHRLQQLQPQQPPQDVQSDSPLILMATNIVVALDLVGLLLAYAAGSSRTMDTSLYVIVLIVTVVIYIIVVHVWPMITGFTVRGGHRSNTQAGLQEASTENISMVEQMAGGRHAQADAPQPLHQA